MSVLHSRMLCWAISLRSHRWCCFRAIKIVCFVRFVRFVQLVGLRKIQIHTRTKINQIDHTRSVGLDGFYEILLENWNYRMVRLTTMDKNDDEDKDGNGAIDIDVSSHSSNSVNRKINICSMKFNTKFTCKSRQNRSDRISVTIASSATITGAIAMRKPVIRELVRSHPPSSVVSYRARCCPFNFHSNWLTRAEREARVYAIPSVVTIIGTDCNEKQ